MVDPTVYGPGLVTNHGVCVGNHRNTKCRQVQDWLQQDPGSQVVPALCLWLAVSRIDEWQLASFSLPAMQGPFQRVSPLLPDTPATRKTTCTRDPVCSAGSNCWVLAGSFWWQEQPFVLDAVATNDEETSTSQGHANVCCQAEPRIQAGNWATSATGLPLDARSSGFIDVTQVAGASRLQLVPAITFGN